MVSIFLVGIWNVIYFYYWYKENFVYAGMDVVGYTLQTKKAFIVWSLFLAFAFDFLYAYFQCVAILYKTTKDGPDPPSKGFGFGSLNPIGGDDKSKEDEDKAKADEDKKKWAPKDTNWVGMIIWIISCLTSLSVSWGMG